MYQPIVYQPVGQYQAQWLVQTIAIILIVYVVGTMITEAGRSVWRTLT